MTTLENTLGDCINLFDKMMAADKGLDGDNDESVINVCMEKIKYAALASLNYSVLLKAFKGRLGVHEQYANQCSTITYYMIRESYSAMNNILMSNHLLRLYEMKTDLSSEKKFFDKAEALREIKEFNKTLVKPKKEDLDSYFKYIAGCTKIIEKYILGIKSSIVTNNKKVADELFEQMEKYTKL